MAKTLNKYQKNTRAIPKRVPDRKLRGFPKLNTNFLDRFMVEFLEKIMLEFVEELQVEFLREIHEVVLG